MNFSDSLSFPRETFHRFSGVVFQGKIKTRGNFENAKPRFQNFTIFAKIIRTFSILSESRETTKTQ